MLPWAHTAGASKDEETINPNIHQGSVNVTDQLNHQDDTNVIHQLTLRTQLRMKVHVHDPCRNIVVLLNSLKHVGLQDAGEKQGPHTHGWILLFQLSTEQQN